MTVEAIRVRITPRDEPQLPGDPRQRFWALFRESQGQSNTSITELESKLCRELGRSLRSALVHQLSEPIRTLDSELFPSGFRDLERFFFHGPEREWYRYQVADVFSKMVEQRQQLLRESPSLQRAQERIAAAAGVMFATKIVGYSSAVLDLTTGSFGELAKAFDGNFDSFRVFLDAFVPVAFADVFSEAFADRLDFAVTVPSSLEQAFQTGPGIASPAAAPMESPSRQSQPSASARERAEWLWRLANGSLVVPVLLSLFVMYYGLRMLSDIRTAQHDAMRPILEHQLKLLEQDRLRLGRDFPAGTSGVPPPGASTPATRSP